MNGSLKDCVWCDGVCYDQNMINGTGECDRYGVQLWYGHWLYPTFSLLMPVGVLGHFLFWYIVRKKYMKDASMVLLAISLLPTFMQCVWVSAVSFYGLAVGERIMGAGLGCDFEGMLNTFTYGLCLCFSSIIAYERYRKICMPFTKAWSLKQWILLCSAGTVLMFALVVTAAFMDGFHLLYSKLYCHINFSSLDNMMLSILYMLFLLAGSFYCYAKIYIKIHKTFNGASEPECMARRAAVQLMKVYMYMLLCFAPGSISIFLQATRIVPEYKSPPYDVIANVAGGMYTWGEVYFIFYVFPKLRPGIKEISCFADRRTFPESGQAS